jgi:hypothetical protein
VLQRYNATHIGPLVTTEIERCKVETEVKQL